ncbi:hypothetical protein FRC07_014861 [Ceratobasidium sp. 392]|nr:hypothetical protein FRC07_014861 [Ceratobasidium sp. 392]
MSDKELVPAKRVPKKTKAIKSHDAMLDAAESTAPTELSSKSAKSSNKSSKSTKKDSSSKSGESGVGSSKKKILTATADESEVNPGLRAMYIKTISIRNKVPLALLEQLDMKTLETMLANSTASASGKKVPTKTPKKKITPFIESSSIKLLGSPLVALQSAKKQATRATEMSLLVPTRKRDVSTDHSKPGPKRSCKNVLENIEPSEANPTEFGPEYSVRQGSAATLALRANSRTPSASHAPSASRVPSTLHAPSQARSNPVATANAVASSGYALQTWMSICWGRPILMSPSRFCQSQKLGGQTKVPYWRGHGKDKVKLQLAGVYGLDLDDDMALKKHVAWLLDKKFYKGPKINRRTGLYEHPFLAVAICLCFFVSLKPAATVAGPKFKPIPVAAIAYVCALIQCFIEQYKTGELVDKKLKFGLLRQNYVRHVANVEFWMKRVGEEENIKVCTLLYEAAAKGSGKIACVPDRTKDPLLLGDTDFEGGNDDDDWPAVIAPKAEQSSSKQASSKLLSSKPALPKPVSRKLAMKSREPQSPSPESSPHKPSPPKPSVSKPTSGKPSDHDSDNPNPSESESSKPEPKSQPKHGSDGPESSEHKSNEHKSNKHESSTHKSGNPESCKPKSSEPKSSEPKSREPGLHGVEPDKPSSYPATAKHPKAGTTGRTRSAEQFGSSELTADSGKDRGNIQKPAEEMGGRKGSTLSMSKDEQDRGELERNNKAEQGVCEAGNLDCNGGEKGVGTDGTVAEQANQNAFDPSSSPDVRRTSRQRKPAVQDAQEEPAKAGKGKAKAKAKAKEKVAAKAKAAKGKGRD